MAVSSSDAHGMSEPDSSLLSLNTATVHAMVAAADRGGCVRHGIRGSLRPGATRSPPPDFDEAAARIRDAGLVVTGYCRGGMFPAADVEGRRAAIDDNKRAVDEALTVGARCLVLVAGGLPRRGDGSHGKDSAGAREMVRDGIARTLEYARPAGHASRRRAAASDVRRRPRLREHDGARQRSLRRARRRRRHRGRRLSRLVGSNPQREIARAGAARCRLLAYHICDWLVPTVRPSPIAA